jgi:hypothetical protein
MVFWCHNATPWDFFFCSTYLLSFTVLSIYTWKKWGAPSTGDFMPVEHLWHWLREDVTYHTCYDHKADLIAQVERFESRINANPITLADRLWVKSHLDPKEEKLQVST